MDATLPYPIFFYYYSLFYTISTHLLWELDKWLTKVAVFLRYWCLRATLFFRSQISCCTNLRSTKFFWQLKTWNKSSNEKKINRFQSFKKENNKARLNTFCKDYFGITYIFENNILLYVYRMEVKKLKKTQNNANGGAFWGHWHVACSVRVFMKW